MTAVEPGGTSDVTLVRSPPVRPRPSPSVQRPQRKDSIWSEPPTIVSQRATLSRYCRTTPYLGVIEFRQGPRRRMPAKQRWHRTVLGCRAPSPQFPRPTMPPSSVTGDAHLGRGTFPSRSPTVD